MLQPNLFGIPFRTPTFASSAYLLALLRQCLLLEWFFGLVCQTQTQRSVAWVSFECYIFSSAQVNAFYCSSTGRRNPHIPTSRCPLLHYHKMAPSLPTIVIVPGAWHSPAHFKQLIALLKQAGYPVSSYSLPSLEPSDPNATTTTSDSTFIKEKILAPLLEKGSDILLVMHSYGGSPGSVAARGLSKVERISQGLQGGVIGLVFIAALLAPEGASLLAMVGGKFHPWVQIVRLSLYERLIAF